MKIIFLEGSVNEEMKNIVSQALESEGDITFYLNSTGGLGSSACPIIDMINKNKDRVTIIATTYIASNAFNIFFKTKCKREVLDSTEGMAHMARIDTSMSGKRRIQLTPKWQLEHMWKEAKEEAKMLKNLGCPKKIRKQFLDEMNIYFTTKALRKMLKKSENL